MIKCSKCGKQIIFKTKYRPECGNILEYDDKKQKHNVLKNVQKEKGEQRDGN